MMSVVGDLKFAPSPPSATTGEDFGTKDVTK